MTRTVAPGPVPEPIREAEAFRETVSQRCAAFARIVAEAATQRQAAGLKRAAVAVLLVHDGAQPSFILTRRAPRLRSHAGQWALPGGRCDPGETSAQACLREVEEELGLRLGPDRVLGLLDDYPTRSGYLITPLVLWGGSAPDFRPNPSEVAAVHRIPLAEAAREDAVDFVTIPESNRKVVRIRLMDSLIHAPTAAVLYQFREVLAGRRTRVAELEQPPFAWK